MSGGTRFESLPGRQLFSVRFLVFFISIYRLIMELCLDQNDVFPNTLQLPLDALSFRYNALTQATKDTE
jgi:hypothetical protein